MGRIIGVFSGKGGVGKTMVVVNLALALKEFNRVVTIVDCNITTPHLSYYLGAYDYPVTLNNVLRGESDISMVSYYNKGIYIVPSSNYISNLSMIDVGNLKSHLKSLSKRSDVVIIDSAPGFGRESMSALMSCDEIILVSTPRLPELTDAMKCSRIAEGLGIRALGLVINMAGITNGEYSKEHIESMTGLPVLGRISFDRKITESVKLGMPIVHSDPYSDVSESFRTLAAKILSEHYVPKHPLKRIYSRLRHKFKGQDTSRVNLRFEEKVTTVADDILNLVKARESVSIRDISVNLGLSKSEAGRWCKILEDKGLVYVKDAMFGDKAVELAKW